MEHTILLPRPPPLSQSPSAQAITCLTISLFIPHFEADIWALSQSPQFLL